MQMVRKNLPRKEVKKMELNMEELIKLLEERFENNQAKMARILGVSKYQLNTIIKNNGKKAGKKFIGAIIKFCDANEYDFHKYIFLT